MVCFAVKIKPQEAIPGVCSGFESGKPLLIFLSLRNNPVLTPVHSLQLALVDKLTEPAKPGIA